MSRVVRSKKLPKVRCPICLEILFNQEIGIPDCCQHVFCFTCLANWSKSGNSTCPNDRGVFQFIFKKHSITSRKPFAKVNANNTDLEISLEDEEENVKILSCDICDSEEQDYHPLLTCNGCSQSYHEFCLNSFNTYTWICPSCECNNEERPEAVNNLSRAKPTKIPLSNNQTILGNVGLKDRDGRVRINKPLRRLQHVDRGKESYTSRGKHTNTTSTRPIITPKEAASRIAASGLPVLPDPHAAALISRTQYMSELRRKRKLVARLPPKIPLSQLPRIRRRPDAPLRPQSKTITQKSKSLANASFLDKLLQSQHQLRTLENIQIKGAHIKLS